MSNYNLILDRIRLRVLSIEWTKRCPASCDFCFDRHGKNRKEKINSRFIANWTKNFKTIVPSVDSLAITGGEPFLYFEEISRFLSRIRELKFSNLSIITNAYWAKSIDLVYKKMKSLRTLGLTFINVSCDPSHLEFVPIKNVYNLVRGSIEAGIENVVVSGNFYTKYDVSEYFRDELDIINCKRVLFFSHPVYPAGRALDRKSRIKWINTTRKKPKCTGIQEFTVRANGYVSPCCSVLCHNKNLLFGNIYSQSIEEIVNNIKGNFFLKLITTYGFDKLEEIMKTFMPEYQLPKWNYSVCDLCNAVLDQIQNTLEIKKILETYESNYITYHFLKTVGISRYEPT